MVHILGGIFWVGSGLFSAFFLMPALSGSGPALGTVMAGLQRRRLFTALPVAAVLTIGSGLRLIWIASAGFDPAYFAAPSGFTFAASGAAATLAFLLALLVGRPAMQRAGVMAGSVPHASDADSRAATIASLRRRGSVASAIAMWLLLASAVGMAVARYLI